MDKFEKICGIAAPLPMINIDTDMIIPKQFLKTIKRSGLGKNLFHELRYDLKGNIRNDFVLNWEPYQKAKILVTGENFGCGSSREHAPWSLLDFGFRCIIGPSDADIFFNNCFKNGILPVKVDEKIVLELSEYSKRKEEIEVDLQNQEIRFGNKFVKFEVDGFKKKCLMEGLDDIALSLEKTNLIDNFEKKIKEDRPWLLKND